MFTTKLSSMKVYGFFHKMRANTLYENLLTKVLGSMNRRRKIIIFIGSIIYEPLPKKRVYNFVTHNLAYQFGLIVKLTSTR